MKKIHTIYDLTQYSLIFVKKNYLKSTQYYSPGCLIKSLAKVELNVAFSVHIIMIMTSNDEKFYLQKYIAKQSHVILKILFLFFNGLSF